MSGLRSDNDATLNIKSSARSPHVSGGGDSTATDWGRPPTSGGPLTTPTGVTSKVPSTSNPLTDTQGVSSAMLHSLPAWCGQLSWSKAQQGNVHTSSTSGREEAGAPGPASGAAEEVWPSVCGGCGAPAPPPTATPDRNIIRLLCRHCSWRNTPRATSMRHSGPAPPWSTRRGQRLWARHAVLRAAPGHPSVGLLCYGERPAVVFPLLWAIALRRRLRAGSVPGAATVTEREVATAFVAMCASMRLAQARGTRRCLVADSMSDTSIVQMVNDDTSEADYDPRAECVFVWQPNMQPARRANSGHTEVPARGRSATHVGPGVDASVRSSQPARGASARSVR